MKITEKENYMRLYRGELPDWVPVSRLAPEPGGGYPAVATMAPAFLGKHFAVPGPAKDVWGVLHVPVPNTPGAKLPAQSDYLLTDITKWRDVIKAPDISGIDWEGMAKQAFDRMRVNRDETAVALTLTAMPFLNLVAFMGFEGALCAMYEDPDEVLALLDYVTDFYVEVGERCIDYYKPDIFNIGDDTATWKNPFFSLDMYRELIKPYHVRLAKLANDRGIPIDMHCCGRCEDFIDDWRDFGVVSWNPAQTSNDLDAIKKKYGRSLVMIGAWDIVGELQDPDVSEEAVRASVRASMDRYAPDGAYVFSASFLGAIDDEPTIRKNKWLLDEAKKYGADFYKKA